MKAPANDPFLTHTGLPPSREGPIGQWSPVHVAWLSCGLYAGNLAVFSFLIPPAGAVDTRWAIVVASLVFSAYWGYPAPSPFQRKLYDWIPLMCYLSASLLGLFLGHQNYDYLMGQYYALSIGREYTDVLPAEPAGGHLDAGIISFAPGSRLDWTQSSPYRDPISGLTLCAAPIIDDTTEEVSFFAVGIDCCDRAGFWCDDARDLSAQSAAKWTPGMSTMHAEIDFTPACAKSAAIHGLTLGTPQLFLRWLKDPTAFRSAKFDEGLLGFFLYLLLAVLAFLVAFKIKPPRRNTGSDAARTSMRDPFATRGPPATFV